MNGPTSSLRGPDVISSAAFFCASVHLSAGIGGMRSATPSAASTCPRRPAREARCPPAPSRRPENRAGPQALSDRKFSVRLVHPWISPFLSPLIRGRCAIGSGSLEALYAAIPNFKLVLWRRCLAGVLRVREKEQPEGTPAPRKGRRFVDFHIVIFHGGEWSREILPEEFRQSNMQRNDPGNNQPKRRDRHQNPKHHAL